jgi:hypothetical protein
VGLSVDDSVGVAVGVSVGVTVGVAVGVLVGVFVGWAVFVGVLVGTGGMAGGETEIGAVVGTNVPMTGFWVTGSSLVPAGWTGVFFGFEEELEELDHELGMIEVKIPAGVPWLSPVKNTTPLTAAATATTVVNV